MDFDKLARSMGDLDESAVLSAVKCIAAEEPENVQEAIDALSRGMDIIGQRFESFEYFVGDLIFAGEVYSESLKILRPAFPTSAIIAKKKVVLATVEGDLHDLGKNLVRCVLESKGLTVIDMGVNVSPAAIVQRTVEENASVVALSAVLTTAIESMKDTVDAFAAAGMRDRVSIVVGGACVNESVARYIKADCYAVTPEDTAAFCLAAEAGQE